MESSGRKAHLHLADVFRWLPAGGVDRVAVLGAGIGMAGPVVVAAALGDVAPGIAAALGGLMVVGVGARAFGDHRARARILLFAVVIAAVAAASAALAAGHGWAGDAVVIVLAGGLATLGGVSRLATGAAASLVPYLIIALAVAERLPDMTAMERLDLALLIVAGAVWTAAVYLGLGAVMGNRRGRDGAPTPASASTGAPGRRGRAGLARWQYPLRLTSCLAVAAVLRVLWPDHHLYWVALTVALLIEREIEAVPVRTTQRVLGTALGVLAAGLLLAYWPPQWALVLGLGVLASALPLLRARNYFAYAVVMTPVIIVIMDAGWPLAADVLVDRLIATLIGAALVVTANLAVGRAVAAPR